MTPSQDLLQSPPNLIWPKVHWVVKERRGGRWVVVREFHNLVTNFGLTGLAAAPSGQYIPPIYLVIDSAQTTMSAQGNPSNVAIQTTADPTVSGDTQLVLSAGLAAQETVNFSSKSGTAPVTFNLTAPLLNTHPIGDAVVRGPTALDTIASVLSEAQYDPTFNPNNRATMTAAYSPGLGQNIMQFFLSGLTATNLFFAHIGLADKLTIGAIGTNLHNYAPLGYLHNNLNDLEIDVTYTLQVV